VNFAGVKSITIPEGDVKSIAIGGVTVWEKPSPLPYDAEVEYIESTGTQYVDTGVVPDSNTSFETRYIQTSAPYKFCPVAYAGDVYNSSNTFGFAVNKATGINSYFGTAVNLHVGDNMVAIGQTISIRFRRGNANIVMTNETTGITSSSSFGSATYTKGSRTLYLMNGNTGTTDLAHPGCLRIFSFLLYDNNILVRDFVPCRVGQTGYLYDRANPTGGPSGNGLYGSATSTPLVAGPDKNGG